MPRDVRVTGTPMMMTLPDQGVAGPWRFGLDRAGVPVTTATVPDSIGGGDVVHTFAAVPAGVGYVAWYERLLQTGGMIGSRTSSQPFDIVDPQPPQPPQPPTRTYRVSGVITVESL